jgi:hypothetical protein
MNDAYDPLTGFIHCTNGGVIRLPRVGKLFFDALLRANGRPLTTEFLINAAYGHRPDADAPADEDNCLKVHICKLAKRLAGCTGHIENVWGVGYRMVGKFDVFKQPQGRCPCCGQEMPPDAVN